jgi:hypothetical protein
MRGAMPAGLTAGESPLDAAGQARAVNYGFAPTQRLLEQVDAILAQQVVNIPSKELRNWE